MRMLPKSTAFRLAFWFGCVAVSPLCSGRGSVCISRGWRVAGALLAWLSISAFFAAAHAADAPPKPETPPSFESWLGVEATPDVWSVYSGVTWAPAGSVREDGVRVRVASGVGAYRYRTFIDGVRYRIYGVTGFGDVLGGYQAALGALTIKAFAGVTYDGHALRPDDPSNAVDDGKIGGKAVLETWLNLGPGDWVSLDLSGASAHQTYYSRLRLGHRLTPQLSVGLEGGAFGNEKTDNGRGGGFIRYEWDKGEISASGGVTGDIAKPTTPYATLLYLSRF